MGAAVSQRATILMYHILDRPRSDQEAKYCCLPQRFEQQMAWLSRHHSPVGLDRLLEILDGAAPAPENPVAVTFDDGFASTFEHALPVLSRYRIPATMFIVAGRIGADNDWMHRRGRPRRRLMDAAQIREMEAAGVSIGSHTLSHPRLPECRHDDKGREIGDSKARLEDLLGHAVEHFAYPYGQYDDRDRERVAEAGYRSACSTRSGFNNPGTDRFQLRRIEIFGSDRLWQYRNKIRFGTNDDAWTLPLNYYLGRVAARLTGKD